MTYRSCQNILIIGTFLVLLGCGFLPPIVDSWESAHLLRQFRMPTVAAATMVTVWSHKKTGLYYCPDSKLYGKVKPGSYMTQEKAEELGYRPSGGYACR
jgi:hypothetical protein